MFTDRGAAGGLDLETITDDLLRGADLVHFTGYSIVQQTGPVPLRRLLSRIRAAGAMLSVDPASSGFIDHFGVVAVLLPDGPLWRGVGSELLHAALHALAFRRPPGGR